MAATVMTVELGTIHQIAYSFRLYNHIHVASSHSIDLCWRHKAQWILMNSFINSSILVAIVYWGVLSPGFSTNPVVISFDLFEHIFPPIFGVLEIILTPIPVRFQHFIHPVVYLITYISVTIIFYYGDPNTGAIYHSVLDYGNPGLSTITIVGCSALVVVLQLFLWGLYKCRVIITRRLTSSSFATSQVVEMTPSPDADVHEYGDNPSYQTRVDVVDVEHQGEPGKV